MDTDSRRECCRNSKCWFSEGPNLPALARHWNPLTVSNNRPQVCWQAGTWCAGRWNVTQRTQNISITFVQRRPNVFDVGPTLYKCNTNVVYWETFTPSMHVYVTQLQDKVTQPHRTLDKIHYNSKTQNKHTRTQLHNAQPFQTTHNNNQCSNIAIET